MGRYVYVTNVVADLMEKVLEYAGEVEHGFMSEYQETSKEDLYKDFAQYLLAD